MSLLLCSLITNLFGMDTPPIHTPLMDALPHELKQKIVTLILSEIPGEARALLFVSKDFSRIVNDPSIVKSSIARSKKHIGSSFWFADSMRTTASKKYIDINTQLLQETNKDNYLNALKTDPYADVNYTTPAPPTSPSPKLYQALCTEELDWITPLLEHGAHPDEYFGDKRYSATSHVFMNIIYHKNAVELANNLGFMDLFFKHGANIHGVDNDDTLLWDALYNDSLDGLKLLVKHGVKMTEHGYILHEYLGSVEFLKM